MNDVWLISDTHFHHANILKFTGYDGKPMRVFDDVHHMDEHMVSRWNSVVKPEDKVYHLGDVALSHTAEGFKIMHRLNGRKTLILGNHDPKDLRLLSPHFKHIYSSRMLDRLLLTHIPVHPMSLGKAEANVFGHVHNNIVPGQYGPQYYNISIEVLDDYTPIHFEDLKVKIRKQLG
jgi:calcineurin-like phosphoesterase family protein